MYFELSYDLALNILESIHKWLFSITGEDVRNYGPILALTATIIIFMITQHKNKRIESADLCLELNKRFFEEDIKKTREKIYRAVDLNKNLIVLKKGQKISDITTIDVLEDVVTTENGKKITTTNTVTKNKIDVEEIMVTERELESYLNVLEEIGLLTNKKVLDKSFAYEMFSYQIRTVYENKVIKKHIDDERINEKRNDLWDQFEKAYGTITKISIKKKSQKFLEDATKKAYEVKNTFIPDKP